MKKLFIYFTLDQEKYICLFCLFKEDAGRVLKCCWLKQSKGRILKTGYFDILFW